MLDISLLFRIAGIGIIIVVIDKVLKQTGKDEYAVLVNLTGVIIILMMVIRLISTLFDTVRTLFQF